MKQKIKMTMKMPSLAVSKANQEKATKVYGHFLSSTRAQLIHSSSQFSTLATVMRFLRKSPVDPAQTQVLETLRRLQKDKIHAEIALQFSELASSSLQNLQKTLIIQMLPYLLGLISTIVFAILALSTRPLLFSNPDLIRNLIFLGVSLVLLVIGSRSRVKSKFDILALNILMQASSAYASAKLQGKGEIAAMQNLAEMKRRASAAAKKKK